VKEVLVTGATGTVGRVVTEELLARGERVVVAVRDCAAAGLPPGARPVVFDLERPETHAAALSGVGSVFLLRPPHMGEASAFDPFISAVCEAGVDHVVFLSLLGVERNPVVPHYAIEKRLTATGLRCTMLRPSFYMQNLSTTHLSDIRDRDQILLPAGSGRTSLIDARDIGAAAAVVLTEPGHAGRAYALTGPEALTYSECAAILSDVTGRRITYRDPGGSAFAAHMRSLGHPPEFVRVMRAIYLVAKLRLAGTVTDDLPALIGRPATTFERFARDHAEAFSAS